MPAFSNSNSISRTLGLAYAATAFIGTWAFFAWFVIFLGNLPRASEPWLDPSADVGTIAADPLLAALANTLLVALFCLQHSLMARPSVKKRISQVVPPALERATYVHAANLAGFIMLLLWTPIPDVVWSVKNDAAEIVLWTGFAIGWLILFAAAFSINVHELLGLQQAWAWFRGEQSPPLALKTNWLYRYLEHPMYVGVLMGLWMTPHMSTGHMLLAAQFTLYIAIAMAYERRDLHAKFGAAYAAWRGEAAAHDMKPAAEAIARALRDRYERIVVAPLPGRMVFLLARIDARRDRI